MKVLKIIFLCIIVPILLASMLIGCGGYDNGRPSIPTITSIGKSTNPRLSIYYIDNSQDGYNLVWFADSTGKFNVGDTVKLSKN